MNTAPIIAEQPPAKFKTTLYLTEDNRMRLERLSKGNRTKLINQAITEKLNELEEEEKQTRLLDALENVSTTLANGVGTAEALHQIRTKELRNLIVN